MALGLTFLVIKFFEYKHKFDTGHVPGPNFHFEGPDAPQVEIFLFPLLYLVDRSHHFA